MSQTLAQSLASAVGTTAHAYAAGDQIAPCAILWLDPDGLWEAIVPDLQPLMPELGGLGLEVGKDLATLDALAGALPALIAEPLSQLQGRRLDSEFFNGLLAPDTTGLFLLWLSDAEAFRQRRSPTEWKAFCQQCKAE